MNLKILNANTLKVIAIVLVIIDHIGVYFEEVMPEAIYTLFRIIGRSAMPIFAYMIVQGFFHTKNLNKYVKRVFLTGVITQLVLYILYTVNKFVFIDYIVNDGILNINILITFAFSLIIMKVLDEVLDIKKNNKKIPKNLFILIIFCLVICALYAFVQFDYSYMLILYIMLMYFTEKLYREKKIEKIWYYILHILSMLVFLIINGSVIELFAIFALPVIFMYNGEKGKNTKKLKFLFYIFYPLQHFILYLTAMVLI